MSTEYEIQDGRGAFVRAEEAVGEARKGDDSKVEWNTTRTLRRKGNRTMTKNRERSGNTVTDIGAG